MGGSSQQMNSRAINKSLIICSYVYHSSSPQKSQQPLPPVQSQFFPLFIPPCLPLHVSLGSCYFQLLFSLQAYYRKKSQMPFYYLCYTDWSSFAACCLNFPLCYPFGMPLVRVVLLTEARPCPSSEAASRCPNEGQKTPDAVQE